MLLLMNDCCAREMNDLLSRMAASTLAGMLVDLHESLCDARGEDLAALIRQAGIANCGEEEWAVEVQAAEEAVEEYYLLLQAIDTDEAMGG
jgi:hypothetical protein